MGLLRHRILQTSDSLYEVKTVVLRKGILGEMEGARDTSLWRLHDVEKVNKRKKFEDLTESKGQPWEQTQPIEK